MRRFRPLRRLAFVGATVAAALAWPAAGVAGAAIPATPIPSAGPAPSLPAHSGHAAKPRPIRGVPRTPQNPFMAPNGLSLIHNDGWQTDAYRWSGPLGRSPRTFSSYIGRECGSITFDSHGRIVSVCVAAGGPRLYMFDRHTLAVLAQFALPPRATRSPEEIREHGYQDFTGGGYFFLDDRDRVWAATTTRHIWEIAERGEGFVLRRDYDVSRALRPDEKITSALPDSNGLIWFVTRRNGVVGTLNRKTGRVRVVRIGHGTRGQIQNSFAVGAHGDVYIVSNRRMYRFEARRDGTPRIVWQAGYRNSGIHKPSQVDAGSGTTPTIMPGGYVAITDNADPMNVVVYRTARKLPRAGRRGGRGGHRRGNRGRGHGRHGNRGDGRHGAGRPGVRRTPRAFTGRAGRRLPRKVCEVPVFRRGASATENTLIGAGRALIVENNYGYRNPLGPRSGAVTEPGFARVDLDRDGRGCHRVWTNRTDRAPTVVPKISLRSGLIYTYTRPPDPSGAQGYYWTAIDFRTGRRVWRTLAGAGGQYNNNYAGIAIARDGTAYVGTFLGGITALRDGGR